MNNLSRELNKEDFTAIISTIEKNDDCKLELMQDSLGTLWWTDMNSNYETEFRVSNLFGKKLIISRVAFKNKRIGTMTYVFNQLKNIAHNYNIPEIIMQSVQSYEMQCFCNKNNFKPVISTTCEMEDRQGRKFLIGDYSYILEQ